MNQDTYNTLLQNIETTGPVDRNTKELVFTLAKIIDEELHNLKKKYYASASGRSLKETISSKKDTISDKKTRGKFERAMELDESAALENARRERYL